MWKLTKGNTFLPTISLKGLQKIYDQEKNAQSKLRLLSAVHRKRGKSIDEITGLLSKPRRTIHGWLTLCQKSVIDGKDSIKQPWRPATLTLIQRKNLVKDLELGPPHNSTGLWSTKELKDLLKRKYCVEFANQHIWRMLVSLGFSMQRPRKQHYKKPNGEEIAQFKKKLDKKQNITVQNDLLWAHKMKQHSA